MIHNFAVEIRRNLQEFKNFRTNIILANIGFLLLFWGIADFSSQDIRVNVLLLFTWYCSIHGVDCTAYILEDEIMDRTIAGVVASKFGLYSVVLIRNAVQFIFDLLKAGIIFTIIVLFSGVSVTITFGGFCSIVLSIIVMYLLGLCIGSFALIFKRVSSIASLVHYFVLFFSGIVSDIEFLSFLFPFRFLRGVLTSAVEYTPIRGSDIVILFLQAIIYAIVGILLMKWNLKRMYLKGSVAHV